MPHTNINQLERYILIDRMLLQTYPPSSKEIISKCKELTGFRYSLASFEKDIDVMRHRYDAPIMYDRGRRGYVYSDPTYRFLNVNLTRNDRLLLDLTKALLGVEGGKAFMPFFEEVEKTLKLNNQLEKDDSLLEVVQLDRIGCLNISEALYNCIKSLREKKQLRFTYSRFIDEKKATRTLHPYLLREFKGRWFVTGWCTKANDIRTFGLDRMSQTEVLEKKIIPAKEKGIDIKACHQHIYGITRKNELPQEILLRFSQLQEKYVRTQPLHISQEIIEDEKGGSIIRLYLIPNNELRIQLLSYGFEVEVLQPITLREEIKEHLQKALELYKGNSNYSIL